MTEDNPYAYGYARVPRIIRKGYPHLSKMQKLLYIYLRDLCGEEGTCYRSLRGLAHETGFSIGFISENIPLLHNEDLIHAEMRKYHGSGWDIWHITVVDIWEKNAAFIEAEKCSQDEQIAKSVHRMNKGVHAMNRIATKCSPDERSVHAVQPNKNHQESVITENINREERDTPAPDHSHENVTPVSDSHMTTGNIIPPKLTLKQKGAMNDGVTVGNREGHLHSDRGVDGPVFPVSADRRQDAQLALGAVATQAAAQTTSVTAASHEAAIPPGSQAHDAGQATPGLSLLPLQDGAVQASGGNILSRSGEKPKRGKAAPAPVDLKSEPAEIQRRLNERRGYCLETAGEIIQERKAIKAWCTLHTLEEFETVMDALQQDDPYWKKPDNKHRISGVVLARETPKVLAKQRRDQRPPVPEEIDPYSIDWLRQLQAGRVAQA